MLTTLIRMPLCPSRLGPLWYQPTIRALRPFHDSSASASDTVVMPWGITIRRIDGAGNSATASVEVTVPHNP